MKALLITIGVLGLLISIPSSVFAILMIHGFGGVMTAWDWFVLLSPIPCAVLVIAGMAVK
jgi:hypothetical protein